MQFNPIKNLTPERLVRALDQWMLGFFRELGMIWTAMMRRDYQIMIVAPKRMKGVARHGYDVLTLEQIPPGQEALALEQQKFLKNFYDNISVTTALEPDEQGGFALLVRQMMDAVGKRYSVHEIVWQPTAPAPAVGAPAVGAPAVSGDTDQGGDGEANGHVRPTGTAPELTAKFIWCPIWWFEGTRGKLRFLESEFQLYGIDMDPGEWLVTVGDGIMEACSVLYLFKHAPIRSLLAFLERFATPGVHGKTDAQKGSVEWNDFSNAVRSFSEEWAAVTNRGGEISLIEAKSNGDASFLATIEKMDKSITLLWRGADLGTTADKNAVGASLQDEETDILETDDAKNIEETLASQVSRYALAWKFGPDAPQLVYVKLKSAPKENIDQDLKVDEFLVANGAPMAVKSALERYNRAMPEPGEDLLTPAVGGGPGGQDGDGDGKPNSSQKPGKKKTEAANEAGSGLEANALQDFSGAVADVLQHAFEELAQIASIDNPALMEAELKKFYTAYPQLAAAVLKANSPARVLAGAMTAGLVKGLAGLASPGDPPRRSSADLGSEVHHA
jgi:phage gp29-like protein